jgi:tetratricopeptide (TPR) repeat protein
MRSTRRYARGAGISQEKDLKKADRQHIVILFAIGLLALALRLWNVLSIDDRLYANFISDASTYRQWAIQMVAGVPRPEAVFPMGPLYPYFLAAILKLGLSLYSVLFLQAILGSAVAMILAIIGGRLFGHGAGYISGILAALYAPYIFYDGLLLSESLQIFLMSLALLLILPERKMRFRNFKILLGGFLLGIVALGRGTILLFSILLVVYWLAAYFRGKDRGNKRYPIKAAVLIVGVVIGILPAALHNLAKGEFVPISSNFGINLYIGNNGSSAGTYDRPAGLNLNTDFTGRRVAERDSGRRLKSSEVSSFWTNKTLEYLKSDPGSFLAGLAKKAWLYFWWFDIPQAEAIQIQNEFSSVFKLPLAGLSLILVFGIAGFVVVHRDERIWILFLLLVANVAGCVVFFVIGRFRLMGALVLLLTSGAGVMFLYNAIRDRRWRDLAGFSAGCAVVVIVLFLPRPVDVKEEIASGYDNVGTYHYFMKRPDEAIEWFRRALDEDPEHSGAAGNLGALYYTTGEIDSALYYFHKALDIDSTSDKTLRNLGLVARDMGMIDSARYYYRTAGRVAPFGVDADVILGELAKIKPDSSGEQLSPSEKRFNALLNVAERASADREYQRAEKLYKMALEIKPDDIRALNGLGIAYQAQSKLEAASKMFELILEYSQDNAAAYSNLGSMLYRRGLVDSAISLWEKALQKDPDNARIKRNLDYARKQKH